MLLDLLIGGDDVTEELAFVLSRLSGMTAAAVSSLAERYPSLSELRFRAGRHIAAVVGEENIMSPYLMTEADLERTLVGLCEDSVFSHMDTIVEGYFCLPLGIRVGVCGSAVVDEGSVSQIYDISSLCVRFPICVSNVSAPIYERLAGASFYKSALIYSPPGVGKTTVLRDLACSLAERAGRRVAVIDEKRELFADRERLPDNADILVGYPKAKAFEIAARTMNPQYIICDEIGSEEEAWSMLSVQNTGVPIVATAHGMSVNSLLKRSGIELLHEAGVFDIYVGIRRDPACGRVEFDFFDA